MKKHIYHLNGIPYFIRREHSHLVPMDGTGEIVAIASLSIFKRDEIWFIEKGTFNAFIAEMILHLDFLVKEPSLLIRWQENTTDQHIRAYLSILLGTNDSHTVEHDKQVLRAIIAERYGLKIAQA